MLFLIAIFTICSVVLADNSCRFEHPTRGVIDLSTVGFQNGYARFIDVVPISSSFYKYSFNPCYSFTKENCQNAAVCQTSMDGLYTYTLGKQNVSRWTVDANVRPVLTYTSGVRTVSITMICASDDIDQFEIVSEDSGNHYSMILRSRCACWNECDHPTPPVTTSKSPATTTTTSMIVSDACKYSDSRYGTINLRSIGSVSGRPAFEDLESSYPDNYLWSYNPCYQFSEDTCRNVAGCQIDKNRGISHSIGLQGYSRWVNMNQTNNLLPTIIYSTSSGDRKLNVQLICDRSNSAHHLRVLGEISSGEYMMQLTSRCACWNECLEPSPSGLSFDQTVLLIMGGVACVVFLLFCVLMTCLFCSKPNRRYPVMVVNEKTPIIKGAINYRS